MIRVNDLTDLYSGMQQGNLRNCENLSKIVAIYRLGMSVASQTDVNDMNVLQLQGGVGSASLTRVMG